MPSASHRTESQRFRVKTELARGGMGAVFLAYDASTGRDIALKRLLPGAPAKVAGLFEREFHILSSLKHPRIIDVYEYGIDDTGPFYTMELLPGSDLREMAPVEVSAACRYLRDVASSLALLHARRLLHRDVSPRNVRTSSDGRCKLIDFGALTSFGVAQDIVGTAPAIPPEALTGQPLDQRADLFSLGALAYWVLTGRQAYPARHIRDLPDAWTKEPLPPSAHAPGVPPELDRLVLTLLSPDVLTRPASAAEVIDRLTACGGLEPEHDPRTARAYLVGTAFVERDRALARFARRMRQMRSKGQGTSLFVTGDPGVGKSRFVTECALKAQLSGTTVLFADASTRFGPLSTIGALIRQLCLLLPGAAQEVLGPHASLLCTVWEDLPIEPLGPSSAEPGRERAAALVAVVKAAIRKVARSFPLLVAVDNVDDADAESSAILLELARSDRKNLLLLWSADGSTDRSSAPHAIEDESTRIQLRPLTEAGVAALARSAFGDVPYLGRTASHLFRATDGNPAQCMQTMDRWIETGVIRYSAGVWNLPIEIADASVSRARHVESDRLSCCSAQAQSLARVLSLVERPAGVDFCASLLEDSSRPIAAVLEELVEAGILTRDAEHYRFRRAAFRQHLAGEMIEGRQRELHGRLSEVLLASGTDSATRFQAGLHLILAGEEVRGADLVAKEARHVLARKSDLNRTLVPAIPALQAALDVYEKNSRSNIQRLDLLVPLAIVSYEVSYDFAMRYGSETLSRLERALGLASAAGSRPEVGLQELMQALAAAPVLEPGESATDETPNVVVLVEWLIHAAIALTASASAAIDHEAEERFTGPLGPFTLLGAEHPAAVAHEYCRLITMLSEDHLAEAHEKWSDLLEQLDRLPLPPNMIEPLRLGALSCLGTLECKRDDDAAVARLDELERLGSSSAAAVANRLRFLYHGFRGEIDLAEHYREQVEAYAISRGAAWQIEIWSTCTLSAVYGNTRDRVGNRRVVEQLERLKAQYPSLEQYWERALGSQYHLSGDPKRSIEVLERTLARSEPRARVGWGAVRGSLARAYNQLGDHEDARRICLETIALNEDDRDYVAMNLGIYLELCAAEAGLGEIGSAKQRLDDLLEHHAPRRNPMTLGSLHRTGAHIALLEGDTESFEHHLTEMEGWFRPTNNPALIVQCDELRHAARGSARHGWREARPVTSVVTQSASMVHSVLASCRGEDERRRRALELVAERSGTKEAWLFAADGEGRPRLAAKLGVAAPTPALLEEIDATFRLCTEDEEATELVDSEDQSSMATMAEAPTRYRSYPMTVNQDGELLFLGVIAVPAAPGHAGVGADLLHDIAQQLFEAGDVTAVPRAS